MHILWTIIIGFVVGVIAKFLMPGDKYEPKGFILMTILGIVGAFAATYLGQAVGWYRPGQSAGFIGGVVGAIIVLAVRRKHGGRSEVRCLTGPAVFAASGALTNEICPSNSGCGDCSCIQPLRLPGAISSEI
jgi:uncharacterized membrane protein YeaQ/YmgE (transglycosylase-associated protein family)